MEIALRAAKLRTPCFAWPFAAVLVGASRLDQFFATGLIVNAKRDLLVIAKSLHH